MKLFLTAMAFVVLMPEMARAEAKQLTVHVKGMVCGFCAQGIEKKFKAEKEVQSVQVSLEKGIVTLSFKDGLELPFEKIARILKEAGYETDLVK